MFCVLDVSGPWEGDAGVAASRGALEVPSRCGGLTVSVAQWPVVFMLLIGSMGHCSVQGTRVVPNINTPERQTSLCFQQ